MIRFSTLLAATLIFSQVGLGQFPNYPAADRVLGATDFVTVGSQANTAEGLNGPVGVAIDPTTGKLFVVSPGQSRILRFADANSLTNGDAAEAVIGQADFSGRIRATSATGLREPYNLHIDSSGRLWIAEYSNNRVLMYENASNLPTSGAAADLVLGQSSFTTSTGGRSASEMATPTGVFVDEADNVWVADFGNNRVLRFANASSLTNGAAATSVLGQPSFDSSESGTNASTMRAPCGLKVDAEGRLWVAVKNHHRVFRFDNAASLADGAPASAVLGQPDFTTDTPGTSARTMRNPKDVAIDAAGTLYVSDDDNNRVLGFKNAATKSNGAAADIVIGQPDFTSNTEATTDRKLNAPWGVTIDADGALWVADDSNQRVLRFPADFSALPPKLKGKVPKSTSSARLVVKGSAYDRSGISEIRFTVGRKGYKRAAGTTSWKFPVKLKEGKNTILIQAVDKAGNVSPVNRVKVTRR